MKKKTSKKIKLKLPKNKRFHRFFLRKLLICLCVGVLGGTGALYYFYRKEADSYRNDCDDRWQTNIRMYTENKSEKKNVPSLFEKMVESGTEQTFLRDQTTRYDINGNAPSPHTECSAVLIRPQEQEYYVSDAVLRVVTYDQSPNNSSGNPTKKNYYTDPELTEEIAAELQEKSRNQNPYLSLSFFFELFPLRLDRLGDSQAFKHFLTDLGYYRNVVPFRICTDGDTICQIVYGFIDYDGEIISVHSHGKATDGCSVIENPYYPEQNGQYTHIDPEQMPKTEYIPYMHFEGSPTDSEAGRAAKQIAESLDLFCPLLQRNIQEMQDIIDDSTGKKRDAYIRERIKEISEEFREGKKTDPEWYSNERYSMTIRDIYTPEEQISLFQQHFVNRAQWASDQTKFSGTPFYATGTVSFDVNGETWYLLYCEHLDVMHEALPFFITIGILIIAGMLLLALFWSVFAYTRFRHKYEMAEYRRSLTASLAHDLKSPLMAISSFAENIVSDVQPGKKQHYAQAILDNTAYMDNIIINVLELSSLEKGRKVKKETVDIAELTNGILLPMKEAFSERDLSVSCAGSCIMRGDRQMLAQAIRNLLDNALKFTPCGGKIQITCKRHTLRIVNDIAEEQISNPEQLCEAFSKGDNARSNRMGTGLGLSLIRQIAVLNRIRLSLESKEHRFTVQLRQSGLLRAVLLRRPKPQTTAKKT